MFDSHHPVRASVLVVVLGCGPSPGDPDGDGDATGAEASASGSADVGVSTSSAGDPSSASTAVDTTSTTDDTGSTIFDVGAAEAASTEPCEIAEPCPLPGDAFAEVAGTTPLGEFVGAFAWIGRYSGECAGTGLAITPTVEDFETDVACHPGFEPPDPSIYLYIGETFATACTIDGLLTLTHTLDGATAETTPQVELTLCEPLRDDGSGRIEGSFTATERGWNLSGTFVAPRCAELDIACP